MSLKKLFLAESMYCLREVFLDEERKIPEIRKFQKYPGPGRV
jgi:hypothetical protein